MNLKRVSICLIAASLGLGLGAAAQAQFKERTVRLSTGVGKDHPLGAGLNTMAQCLAERSGGKFRQRNFYDSSLGNDVAAMQQVRTGTLDMVLTSTAPVVAAVPHLAIFDLPYLINDEKEADGLLESEKVAAHFAPRFNSAGLENLSLWEFGFRSATNSKHPITKLEDFQGLKMRVLSNKVYVDTFSTLGASPVPIAFPEVYSALETKAVDGQENPIGGIENMKFYEVQKYLSLTRHIYSPVAVMYSKKLFDQLSADEQKAVRECSVAGRDHARKVGREMEAKSLETMKKAGLQVNDLSAAEIARIRDKLKPVYDAQIKTIGDETTNLVFDELKRIRGQ